MSLLVTEATLGDLHQMVARQSRAKLFAPAASTSASASTAATPSATSSTAMRPRRRRPSFTTSSAAEVPPVPLRGKFQ
eukprot:277943-Pyramimonas_sp.AAC.1